MADVKLSDEMRREIRCVRDPAQLSAWADRVEKLEQELRDAKEQLSWTIADDAKTREILGIASENDGSVWHVAKRVAEERDAARNLLRRLVAADLTCLSESFVVDEIQADARRLLDG